MRPWLLASLFFLALCGCFPQGQPTTPATATRPSASPANFAGTWETTYGPMTLTQQGDTVRGTYRFSGNEASIQGKVVKNRLTFTYKEPDATGKGWFELSADGQTFAGRWLADGDSTWHGWEGRRSASVKKGFAGLWKTSYGNMRLTEAGGVVRGIYGPGGLSTIDGKIEGDRLVFRYKESEVEGEGWFRLTADNTFEGRWRAKGKTQWSAWTGTRVQPTPGRSWLVVLEANWESSLNEQEYAFGAMLRAFFARSSAVQVRHRWFTDLASLSLWCREVAYLAEPVVLLVATHGTPKGVAVNGKTIGARELAECLRYCDNIKLLHFSACLLMKDRLAAELVRHLEKQANFPISGYSTTVDWAGSAVIEFLYLDLILLRKKTPAQAAEQVLKLMPFAGDRPIQGAVLPPAGFKLLTPGQEKTAQK